MIAPFAGAHAAGLQLAGAHAAGLQPAGAAAGLQLAVLPGLLTGAAVVVLLGVPVPSRRLLPSRPARPPAWPRLLPWLAAGVLLVLSGPMAAALGVLGGVAIRRALARRSVAALRMAERHGAAEALAVLSTELRAGRPPDVALVAASGVATGPLAKTLRAAGGSSRVGGDPAACLLGGAEASAVPDLLKGLAACWLVCSGAGSSLATAVERLAESLRAAQAQALLIEAELAGPRATAGMLALLPIAGLGLAAGLGADPLRILLHSQFGAACLVVGVALDAGGLWWTGRIVRAAGGQG